MEEEAAYWVESGCIDETGCCGTGCTEAGCHIAWALSGGAAVLAASGGGSDGGAGVSNAKCRMSFWGSGC